MDIFTDAQWQIAYLHCRVFCTLSIRETAGSDILSKIYRECFTCMSAFNTVVSPMNRQTCSCACSKACACATCPFHVQCKPKIRSEKVLLLPALPLLTRPAYLACLRGLSNSSCTLRKLKDWPNDDLGSHFLEPELFQTKIFGCLLLSSFTFNLYLGTS